MTGGDWRPNSFAFLGAAPAAAPAPRVPATRRPAAPVLHCPPLPGLVAPAAPLARRAERRARAQVGPHPEGVLLPTELRERAAARHAILCYLWRPDRLDSLLLPATQRLLRERGCPHRRPVLQIAWLLRRTCPICRQPLGPTDRAHGSVDVWHWINQQFCSDVCSRHREEVRAPTRAEIAAATAAIRETWDETEYRKRAGLVPVPQWRPQTVTPSDE